MNTIESSVTRLLMATKQLLESLTSWSKGVNTVTEVSNAYVQLGGDFKIACRAFSAAGVDVKDLGDVPHSLRVVLEEALSEEPSQASLDRYLPQIRKIIVTLLRNLKDKQAIARELKQNNPTPSHSTTNPSTPSAPATVGMGINSRPGSSRRSSHSPHQSRQSSVHQRQSGAPSAASASVAKSMPQQRIDSYRALSEGSTHTTTPTAASNTTAVQVPIAGSAIGTTDGLPPLPATPTGIGIMPKESPSLTSPATQQVQHTVVSSTPSRTPTTSMKVSTPANMASQSSAPVSTPNGAGLGPAPQINQDQSEALKQLQNGDSLKRRASRRFSAYQFAKLTKQTEIPLPKDMTIDDLRKSPLKEVSKDSIIASPAKASVGSDVVNNSTVNGAQDTTVASISMSTSEPTGDQDSTRTVFLRIGNRTKKATLSLPVTVSSLRLLFVEKFAYSPGSESFPDIYVQDSLADIPYELEEHLLKDLRDGSLLSLNQDTNVTSMVKSLEGQVNNLQTQIAHLQTSLQESITEAMKSVKFETKNELENSKEIGQAKSNSISSSSSNIKPISRVNTLDESDIADLRREISVIKQISTRNKNEFVTTIKSLLGKISEFKNSGFDTSSSGNRNYMETCHSKLSEDSDELLTKVDDLQDVIEALRKDVAQRGIRPSERQLQEVKHDIDSAQKEIKIMHDYIITEKPNWKAIWEKELDIVCEEQQFFELQENLVDDLREDLTKALETFSLVENVAREHQKNKNFKPVRQPQLPLIEPGQSITSIRDAMLNEVAALQPNHKNRLEAIEKAEKNRERFKNAQAMNEFEEELGGFVENNKLKKTGGIEETERIRQLKNEQNLKSSFAVF